MLKYFLKKLLYGILVLLGVITIVFSIYSIKPGDPATLSGGQQASKEVVDNIRKEWGIDQPIHIRYFQFLNDVSLISFYNTKKAESRFFYDDNKFKGAAVLLVSSNFMLFFSIGSVSSISSPKKSDINKPAKFVEVVAFSNTLSIAATQFLFVST